MKKEIPTTFKSVGKKDFIQKILQSNTNIQTHRGIDWKDNQQNQRKPTRW